MKIGKSQILSHMQAILLTKKTNGKANEKERNLPYIYIITRSHEPHRQSA